jgi:hypothetical protein
MPDGDYGSIADVEHAFGQEGHRSTGSGGKATGAAQKGGQHSRRG